MKHGIEYAHSREKRVLDHTLVTLARPAYWGSKLLVAHFATLPSTDTVMRQTRVGVNEKDVTVFKLRTLDDATGQPINRMVDLMRKLGLDETPQIINIRNGSMSAIGHRPIERWEHEEFMDNVSPRLQRQWREVVAPTRPGALSTHGIAHHIGYDETVNQFEARAEGDIKDVLDGSIAYDLKLIADLAEAAIGARLH